MKKRLLLFFLALSIAGFAQKKKEGPYIPQDKQLDAEWVNSLFQKGEQNVYQGDELRLIAMPCGGIGAGQVEVTGDGRICFTESVYNQMQQPNGGHIHAYPCMGFHELNNTGLVGACECDIRSAATMVAFTAMTGRPGYISDPVIDTSKRSITYAHCVAPNKMFGPAGPSNPFSIMTHSEDRQGAAVRSILPLGYLTTSLKIDQDRKEIVFHQAKAVANDPDDRACRTKLCTEPIGDIEKLFTMWDPWGWHRVTFYGDLKEPIYALADAIDWKVVEEA